MQATEVLRGVLDQWKAGVDAHEPEKVAALFTEDAIFQGLRPYSVGQAGVAKYYDDQPLDMTVAYEILGTRSPTDDFVVGYVRADFTFSDRPAVRAHIGVVLTHGRDGWRIVQYQASLAD